MDKWKTNVPPDIQQLAEVLDEALHLFESGRAANEQALTSYSVQPSLFEQCIELCKQGAIRDVEPIRTIHHLSCTGGTLITKCLAAMPNVMVLNEVDPLSTMANRAGKPTFSPTDMVALVRQGNRNVSEELLIKLFLENLKFLHGEFGAVGKRILLRDHSHSHFLHGDTLPKRPSLLAMVAREFATRSVVTVRDPVDSFLSVQNLGWLRFFKPSTFDEYCRRYLAFLDAYEDVPIVRYEDFVNDPPRVIFDICQILGLKYSDMFMETFDTFQLSGDSGRSSNVIEARPRRAYDAQFISAVNESLYYSKLIRRLGYSAIIA